MLQIAVQITIFIILNDLDCRPVETPVWSADRQIERFGVQTINTTIGSGKPQIVVLLLLLPLLLIVMPVVLLMVRSNTIWSADRADLNLMILYLCLSCRVTFACTIFIVIVVIIHTCSFGSTVPDTPYSICMGEA